MAGTEPLFKRYVYAFDPLFCILTDTIWVAPLAVTFVIWVESSIDATSKLDEYIRFGPASSVFVNSLNLFSGIVSAILLYKYKVKCFQELDLEAQF